MKKSDINPEELVRDLTNAIDLISQVENIDFSKWDLDKIKKDIETVDTNLKEKYKDVLKEAEDDLDSEE
tara:strand:+ start:434 stop:640 length:207 start_codon:yes stop_codon:yes gene_type:complete